MAKSVLGGGLDVGEFWEDSERLKSSKDTIAPYSITGEMFGSARKNQRAFGDDLYGGFGDSPAARRMAGSIFDGEGSNALVGGMLDQFKHEIAAGVNTLGQKGTQMANDIMLEAQKKANKKSKGSGWSQALGTIGSIAGTVGTIASFFCDERVKTDIAPLQVSEVDDALSQMAFAVKAIREHA